MTTHYHLLSHHINGAVEGENHVFATKEEAMHEFAQIALAEDTYAKAHGIIGQGNLAADGMSYTVPAGTWTFEVIPCDQLTCLPLEKNT